MDSHNLFQAFEISAQGLSAQRARLNVIAANLANAQTTRTPQGGPYRRRVVTVAAGEASGGGGLFRRLLEAKRALGLTLSRTSVQHFGPAELQRLRGPGETIRHEVAIDDVTPPRLEYEPGHPDARPDGWVEYPNVEVIREMTDLMAASRAYEANVTVLSSTKAMLKKALEI